MGPAGPTRESTTEFNSLQAATFAQARDFVSGLGSNAYPGATGARANACRGRPSRRDNAARHGHACGSGSSPGWSSRLEDRAVVVDIGTTTRRSAPRAYLHWSAGLAGRDTPVARRPGATAYAPDLRNKSTTKSWTY